MNDIATIYKSIPARYNKCYICHADNCHVVGINTQGYVSFFQICNTCIKKLHAMICSDYEREEIPIVDKGE